MNDIRNIAANASPKRTNRFLIVTLVVAVLHVLVTGFLAMSFWGSTMASFKRNTSSETQSIGSLYRVWNYGYCVAVEFYESRIAGPLPKFPREEFYEGQALKEQYQRDRMEYYSAVQARGRIHHLFFLLWPVLIGSTIASLDTLRHHRSANHAT